MSSRGFALARSCVAQVASGTIDLMRQVPADPLAAIFTRDALDRLVGPDRPSPQLALRLRVLTAHGPMPDADYRDLLTTVRHDRAQRAAWDAYVGAAFACGFFEHQDGADLRRRLTDVDDNNFRSAVTECMACWFLAGKLRQSVSPRPVGAPGKVPDLCIERDDGNITVEVKAPYREPLPVMHSGVIPDDSDMLASAVDEANRQFARGTRNLLFLVPTTRSRRLERRELIKAFFGQTKIVVPLDLERPGTRSGPAHTEFFAEGKLLKLWDRGRPRFTRISAVIAVREGFAYARNGVLPQDVSVIHTCHVLHNPYCPCPAPQDIWGDSPQLVRDGDYMRWTDGHEIM
jgi:hypothetical protein